jgi:hypothetical protein
MHTYGLQLHKLKAGGKSKVILFQIMKAHRRSRDIAPPVLNLSSKWRSVVKFTPWLIQPSIPREKVTG